MRKTSSQRDPVEGPSFGIPFRERLEGIYHRRRLADVVGEGPLRHSCLDGMLVVWIISMALSSPYYLFHVKQENPFSPSL
jgi:hypothetical protein